MHDMGADGIISLSAPTQNDSSYPEKRSWI